MNQGEDVIAAQSKQHGEHLTLTDLYFILIWSPRTFEYYSLFVFKAYAALLPFEPQI